MPKLVKKVVYKNTALAFVHPRTSTEEVTKKANSTREVTSGNLWSAIQPIHGFTAIVAALMTALAIVALVYQAAKKPRWQLSWDALLLLALYVGSMYVVYRST